MPFCLNWQFEEDLFISFLALTCFLNCCFVRVNNMKFTMLGNNQDLHLSVLLPQFLVEIRATRLFLCVGSKEGNDEMRHDLVLVLLTYQRCFGKHS